MDAMETKGKVLEPEGMDAVEVRTARLLLRKPRPKDFPRLWGMLTDPEAKRFTGGVTRLSYEERFRLFLDECGTPFSPGCAELAVIEMESGLYIGYCGFRLTPGGTPEALYGLCRDAWGKGYATEALRAALGWCFAVWPHECYAATVEAGNEASERVLRKAGFARVPAEEGEGVRAYRVYKDGWGA